MKKRMIALLPTLLALAVLPSLALAETPQKAMEGALDTFSEGCRQELTTLCKEVTPGEGRILACLYAFSDKLTPRCEYALYDSIVQLDRTLTNLAYAVSECRDDLKGHCAGIQPGEGRLLECLNRNTEKLSGRCRTALQDVGYTK
jgi:hypothetical protein